jgi:endoglucanase
MRANRRITGRLLWAAALGLTACRHAPPPKPGLTGPQAGSPVDPSVAPPPLSGHNILYNDSFNQGSRALPWTGQFSVPADGRTFVQNGELCAEIKNGGQFRWDAQLRQQHVHLLKGHTYAVQFKMHSTKATRVYLKLGQAGPPYHEFFKLLFTAGPQTQVYSGVFTMQAPDDPSVELAFHLGGQLAKPPFPFTVCIDDAHIDDPKYTQTPEPLPPAIPRVLVNQIGYLPALTKLAIVKGPAATAWELRSAQGQTVANGTTVPFAGTDPDSGETISVADFSVFAEKGDGYTLKVGNDVSHPFAIRDDLYRKLKYDALSYFYQTRSGIEIKMPYAGDPQWSHPAGHVGVKPNHGDGDVPCAPGSGCDYKLDVTGGWYDAGDHGKYLVSAGISVWTLLDWWERTKAFGTSAGDFADGKMNIPENKNDVPDLLDEVRWELEFELKMQVPDGQKLAGMVHAKVHDVNWTQLSTAPQEDPMVRYLQPATTIATLNLAANAAQAARVWKKIDPAFSARCLAAAEKAWEAARANPEIYQSKGGVGGGPYDDDHAADDFYWAAAELYITTGKAAYKEVVTKSEYFKDVKAASGEADMLTAMTWSDVQSLGSISLAVVPNGLGREVSETIRKNIIAAADAYLAAAQKSGYHVPFAVPPKKGYPWGSNSFVLNNGLILGLAHDFSHDVRYLNGVAAAMDYILGRNPLDQSYVTGWGARPLENPYHRFWCHQANPKYPPPPPGVLSGGPNSGFEDPYMQGAGLDGCAPEKCFIDNGEAWSANEVTINWNAPLAWVAAYLDEAGRGSKAGPHAAKSGSGASKK